MGTMYAHYSEGPWDPKRWPNFSAQEMACRHCGEYYYEPLAFDHIQMLRTILGKPIHLNCAHRCGIHNAQVGGEPMSQHKQIAFDVSTNGQDRGQLLRTALTVGFTGTGFYDVFLHLDLGRKRQWYGTKGAKELWMSVQH